MFTNVRGECQDFARLEVLFWNIGFCNQGFRLANARWRSCWLNWKENRKEFSVYIKRKNLFDIRLFCHIKLILKNLENDIFKNYIYVLQHCNNFLIVSKKIYSLKIISIAIEMSIKS